MSQSKSHYKNESSFTIFILTVLQTITVSVEVFIRVRMGERYMTILRATWMFCFFMLFWFVMSGWTEAFSTNGMSIFYIVSFFLAMTNAVLARRRHSKNIELHSYYTGIPLLSVFFPNKKETTIKNFLEPLFLFVVGVILFSVGKYYTYETYGLGAYIAIVSIVLFIKNQIEYDIARNRYLDVVDKKIESEMLNDAIQGKNPADTKGFSIPGPKNTTQQSRKSVENMYRSLNPELKKLMDKGQEKLHDKDLSIERTPIQERDKSNDIEREL